MEKRKMNTRYMATLAMFCGVLLVMGVTGIGFIPLPVIKATTMHIPVILGAVLLGPGAGAVLGGVFGLCSIWANTTSPGLLAFAFSPFMTTEGLPGVLKSLWIALGCRILFGAIAGWLWKLFKEAYEAGLCGAAPDCGNFHAVPHNSRHGQHLCAACPAVRTGEKCGHYRRFWTCDGNGHGVRNPGGHHCRHSGDRHRKGAAAPFGTDEKTLRRDRYAACH